jgi:hypothetical protein
MTSVDAKGQPTQRTFVTAMQKDAKGNYRYLLRFLSPDAEKGITLLVQDNDGGDVNQYLFLPGLDKPTKIEGSGRAQGFMDSDFTFEDLRKEKPGEWTYARLDDDKEDGTDCYVILSDPADKNREKITGYTDRLVYVDKATFDIRRIQFYDSKHKLIKQFDAFDYGPTNTTTQRPQRAVMTNETKGTTTVLTLLASRLNKPLDDKFFELDTIQHWGADQDKTINDLLPQAAAPAPGKNAAAAGVTAKPPAKTS